MPVKDTTYRRWLKAAYRYYISGEDPEMTDTEWDMWSREFYASPETYTDDDSVLQHHNFTGGSLFWLSPADYPAWAKE
jgi:hypothetical protein